MLPFVRSPGKPGWLSILAQDGRLTLVYAVRNPGGRPAVALLESYSLDTGVRDALRRLRSSRKLAAYRCTTLMGDGEYNVAQFDAPAVPKEERKEALRWSLRDLVDYPLEAACIDILDVPGDGLPGRVPPVLVVSAAESLVKARTVPFEEAGVPLDAVDIPELAQRNVAALFEQENRGLVMVRLGEHGLMLTLTYRGELVSVRRGEINTRQLVAEDSEQRARVRERLVLEVQRSLDNFDRQYSYIPVSRVVLAADPVVEALAAELAANVYVPVEELNLAAVLDLAGIPELRDVGGQARHLLAVGAALRSVRGGEAGA